MAQENEQVEEGGEDIDLTTLPDDTDWKAKAQELEQKRREDGIRGRERTKALKDKLAAFEADPRLKAPEKTETKPDDRLLEKLERASLRSAGITHPDDIELARKTAKKWNVDIDEVLEDEDFKVKLERQQTSRANIDATSNIKGGAGASNLKNTPEYWIAKNMPPNPADVPDRKTRVKILQAQMALAKTGGKQFYND